MLALLFKGNKSRQEALLILASFVILTILYLLLLRYANVFPKGVPEIFTFIYGIFITIDAYALLISYDKRHSMSDERRTGENIYLEHVRRYDLLLKEVRKEIERLEEMEPRLTGQEQAMVSRQIESFRHKIFHLQEEKFAEIERSIHNTKEGTTHAAI